MELNEEKIQLISHHFKRDWLVLLKYSLHILAANGQVLELLEYMQDLAIRVSESLSWMDHIGDILNKARQKSACVLSTGIFYDRSPGTMLTLFKSLVRSLLEYCCPLWHSRKIWYNQATETIQRTFTAKIVGMHNLNYWERLQKLHLLSLQWCRERFIIFHMWKIANGKCDNDIK